MLCWTGDFPAQCEVGKFLRGGVHPCRRDTLEGKHKHKAHKAHSMCAYIRERGSVLYLGMAQEFWDFANFSYSLTWLKCLPNSNQRYRETHAA